MTPWNRDATASDYASAARDDREYYGIASLEVIARALAGFRRLHGNAANPNDLPREWARVVRETREDLASNAREVRADMEDNDGE